MRLPRVASAAVIGSIAVVLLTAVPSSQGRRNGGTVDRSSGWPATAREVLVKFRQPDGPLGLTQTLTDVNVDELEVIGRSGVMRLRSRSLNVAALVARLRDRDDVVYVEPNYIVQTFATPNDPDFTQLWGLRNLGQVINGLPGVPGADVDAAAAWDVALGSTAHVVGVIDTGIDYTHPDLASNIWSAPTAFTVTVGGVSITCAAGTHGFNAITMTCDPMDDHSHGTHVSGTIGAVGDNGIGVTGVNWTTRLMGLKFLDDTGAGSTADAIKAIQFAAAVRDYFAPSGNLADVRVLSASWGGSAYSQALADEIAVAGGENMLFVAAAGNQGLNTDLFPSYPASFDLDNIVAVAATTNTDARAWFSNYGAASVDLGAPGAGIYSTLPGGTYGFSDGTSMATPHVSGTAALVLSRCAVDTAQLKDILIGSVEPVPGLAGLTVTGGRLNANSALHACIAPPAAPSDLVARGEDGRIVLTWSAALGATGYNVKRSLSAGGPYTLVAANVKSASYTDSSVTNGTPYFYVVSAVNTLGESGHSNEASATPSAPSDLVVSALSVPTSGAAGTSVLVTATTRNQGQNPAPASVTRFFLSLNSGLDSSDLELQGAQNVPPLAAGAESTASTSVPLPVDLAAGFYFVIGHADADDQVGEVYETNNLRAASIAVGPDLAMMSLTVPTSAGPGQRISVSDTVMNRGGAGAPASTTRFFVSNNTTLSPDDVQLGDSRSVPALSPNASSSGTTMVTIPATVGTGTIYLIAWADADQVIGETQEGNNTTARAIQIGADLIVSSFTVPFAGGAGEPVTVNSTIKNQGSSEAGASTVRFYLSANAILDAGDTLLSGSRAVGALTAGASSSGATVVTLPPGLAPISYFVIAKADADDQVFETQETNNTAARGISIGPDLRVTISFSPSSITRGSTLTVSDTVTNSGGGAAGASTTRYYLSTNATFDGGDLALGASRAVPALAAGASSTGSTPVLIPASVAPGSYYLLGVADADGAVAERYEINNVGPRGLQVVN